MEVLILRVLSIEDWKTEGRVREELEDVPDVRRNDIPAILRNLKERGACKSATGSGYLRLLSDAFLAAF